MNRSFLAFIFGTAAFLRTSAAFAGDDDAPPGTGPKPVETKPAEAKPAETAPAPAAGSEDLRLRIGYNIGAGPLLGDISGFNLGFGFRIGAQFHRLLAAYVQTGGNALFGFTGGFTAIAFVPISPMLSFNPIDELELAAGPSADYYSGGRVTSSSTAGSTGSFAFGIATRLALHLGSRDNATGRRSGFTIGMDIHPVFVASGAVVPMTIGLGGDWF